MELFNKYYSKIWQSIIRPPRENYSRSDLGTIHTSTKALLISNWMELTIREWTL